MGVCQGGMVNAPTHRLHPPLLPALYPHLKKAGAPPVESLRQRAQHNTRQRWNTYKEVYPMNPTEARKRIVHIYRDRTTMPHLPPTRAPVGPTRPPIRRTSTARPAQNPKTPVHQNRPRHRLEYVGLMPVVLLDNIVLDWSRQGVPAVNDVLAHLPTPLDICAKPCYNRDCHRLLCLWTTTEV